MKIVTKTAQGKHKNEYIDQWTIIKDPEVDTNRNSHLFPKIPKTHWRDNLLNKWCYEN